MRLADCLYSGDTSLARSLEDSQADGRDSSPPVRDTAGRVPVLPFVPGVRRPRARGMMSAFRACRRTRPRTSGPPHLRTIGPSDLRTAPLLPPVNARPAWAYCALRGQSPPIPVSLEASAATEASLFLPLPAARKDAASRETPCPGCPAAPVRSRRRHARLPPPRAGRFRRSRRVARLPRSAQRAPPGPPAVLTPGWNRRTVGNCLTLVQRARCGGSVRGCKAAVALRPQGRIGRLPP